MKICHKAAIEAFYIGFCVRATISSINMYYIPQRRIYKEALKCISNILFIDAAKEA